MISAFCFLIARQQDIDSHRLLGINLLAQHGDERAVKSQLEQWEEEAS
jgi:hypothetical protein